LSILEPFEEATRELSSSLYPSLSKIIPIVRLLLRSLDQPSEETDRFVCLMLLKEDLKNNLENRFSNIEEHQMKAMATYLDPRLLIHLVYYNLYQTNE
jgi:hypothetical protein